MSRLDSLSSWPSYSYMDNVFYDIEWRRIFSDLCCINNNYQEVDLLFFFLFSDFEEALKLLRWPLVAMTIKAPPAQNHAEVKAKMEQLFKQLLKLQLPYLLKILIISILLSYCLKPVRIYSIQCSFICISYLKKCLFLLGYSSMKGWSHIIVGIISFLLYYIVYT